MLVQSGRGNKAGAPEEEGERVRGKSEDRSSYRGRQWGAVMKHKLHKGDRDRTGGAPGGTHGGQSQWQLGNCQKPH